MKLPTYQLLVDSLNAEGPEATQIARRERNEVREVAKWKKRMEKQREGDSNVSSYDLEMEGFLKTLEMVT